MNATAQPPDLAETYRTYSERWRQGDRDRELALQLMFLAWWHWAEPPFLTGLHSDSSAPALWREIFAHFGGADSSDAEFLYVAAIMARLFPYALGDESAWADTAVVLDVKARGLHSAPFPTELFRGRGAYGDYFSQWVNGRRW